MRSDTIKNAFNTDFTKVWFAISPRNTIVDYVESPRRPISNGILHKESLDCLRTMSNRADIGIILYDPDSAIDTLQSIEKFLRNQGIFIDHLNENPSVYKNRVYYDILISEKSGFNPTDWKFINSEINKYYLDYDSILEDLEYEITDNIYDKPHLFEDIFNTTSKNIELDSEIGFKTNSILYNIQKIKQDKILTSVDLYRIFHKNKYLWELVKTTISS